MGKMAQETFYMCHGVDAHIQSEVTGQEVGRYGWGTVLRQPAATGNWVHFPVTIHHGNATDPAKVPDLATWELDCTLNQYAVVTALHVWQGKSRIFSTELELRGGPGGVHHQVQRAVDPRRKVTLGLNVCVRVEFQAGHGTGEAIFHSAGACLLLVVPV